MQTQQVGFEGKAPVVTVGQGNPEALKYGRLWELPEYRAVAPGEDVAQLFLAQARPRAGAELIDFGCGTGRGALALALFGGLRVTLVDFVGNCLDPEVREALTTQAHALRFVKADLERPLPVGAEYGYCTDVMEHIPPDKVGLVLNNILRAARHVFFTIATCPDSCGEMIGETLHLTVQPYAWWLKQFRARDCVVHWSTEVEGACLFYVSAWMPGEVLAHPDSGALNISQEAIEANVRANISGPWQTVQPHVTNDFEAMILGGGPSMAAFEDEIKRNRADGMKLITLNGAYNWALARGLVPSAQILCDARPFNARFTKPVVDECLYLLASQCDPACFDDLPPNRTWVWHTGAEAIKPLLDAQYDVWWAVPGGSTVLLRAIPLLRMLGYWRFHLYGCDSCLAPSGHHAYDQPENDTELVINVTTEPDGRAFRCHCWMASQAQQFLDLIKMMGDVIELEVHGDGLLAHMLNTGATLADNDDGETQGG